MISNHHQQNSKQKAGQQATLKYHSTNHHHLYFYNDPTHQCNVEISYFERPKKPAQQQNTTIRRNYSFQHNTKPKYRISDNFTTSTNSSFDSSFPFTTDDDEVDEVVNNNKKKIVYKNNNTSIALKTTHITTQRPRSNHATPDSAYATLTNSSNNTINKNLKYNKALAPRYPYEQILVSDTSSINDVSSNFSLEKPSLIDFKTKQNQQQQRHQFQQKEQDYRFHESSLIVQKCESEIIFDDSKYYSRCKTPAPHVRHDDSYKVSKELMQNSLLNSTLNTCDFDNMDTSELGDYIDKLRIQFRLNSNLYTNYKNMSFLKDPSSLVPVTPRQSPANSNYHRNSVGSISNRSISTLKSSPPPNVRQTNNNQTFDTGIYDFVYT